jgi:hypothetical protein
MLDKKRAVTAVSARFHFDLAARAKEGQLDLYAPLGRATPKSRSAD